MEQFKTILKCNLVEDLDNFFALRTHPDAQPEIRKIAVMMKDAYDASHPKELTLNDWHLPLVADVLQLKDEGYSINDLCLISVGRCARVSYLTHNGTREPEADIELALRLQMSGHMSPFEHVARPVSTGENYKTANFRGWVQYRKSIVNEDNFMKTLSARKG